MNKSVPTKVTTSRHPLRVFIRNLFKIFKSILRFMGFSGITTYVETEKEQLYLSLMFVEDKGYDFSVLSRFFKRLSSKGFTTELVKDRTEALKHLRILRKMGVFDA